MAKAKTGKARAVDREHESRKREILELLYQDTEPLDIMDRLSLDSDTFDRAMADILQDVANEITERPVEHNYAHFLIKSTAILRKLADRAKDPKTHARDAVTALKTQFDIRHTLLKEARAMGVIEDRSKDTAGDINVWVSQLSNDEIRRELMTMLKTFSSVDVGLTEVGLLEPSAKPMFSGPSVFDVPANETPEDDS